MPVPFRAIWCLHAAFHNNAQRGSPPVLLTQATRPHMRGLALTLSIDCFYGIPAVKCALTGSFVLLARQVLLHGSGTVPDVTCLSKMSDTTYGPLGFTASCVGRFVVLESPAMTC